jgi:hypothetical protein
MSWQQLLLLHHNLKKQMRTWQFCRCAADVMQGSGDELATAAAAAPQPAYSKGV